MRTIYGHADRVRVWLRESTEDGEAALESIRLAAEEQVIEHQAFSRAGRSHHPRSLYEFTAVRMVSTCLGASRILILWCGGAEITGHALCDGVSAIGLLDRTTLKLKGLFRSVSFDIKGAVHRSRYRADQRRDLIIGEQFDKYHTHKATVRHDKLYAVLGLSVHDPNTTALAVGYRMPWNPLLQQVISGIFAD
ncbi:hypothetical protein BBP40_000716 [Aspergillus hancockii]|nr:hypothetical protein BBP40_000716 [Aspergillus hancockii]